MFSISLQSFISTLSPENAIDLRDHTIDPCDDLHARDGSPYDDPRPDAHDDAIDTPSAGALVQKFRAVLSASDNKLKTCQLLTEWLVAGYLRHQEHFHLLSYSFYEVMQEKCPNYKDSCDSKAYKEFVSFVKEGNIIKQRRITPLNKARENWGRDKPEHYGWFFESEKFCKALGPAQKHSWEKAVDMLNQFISRRARKGRVKDSANPIETVDLLDLAKWDGKGPFNKTGAKGDTLYSVKYAKLSTADVPDGYRLDQHGLLVLGKYGFTDLPEPSPEPSPVQSPEPSPVLSSEPSPVPSSEPLPVPSSEPSPVLSSEPSPVPSSEPLPVPSSEPSPVPSSEPSPELSSASSPTSQQSTPSSSCSTSVDVLDACPAPLGNSESRVGVRRSTRVPQQLTPANCGSIRRVPNTRKPPLNKAQTQQKCSCVPSQLLPAIERGIYMANDEVIMRNHRNQQSSLCQEHLKKYAIWSTNVGLFLDQKAPPATARIMDKSFANPYPHQSQCAKRRRSLPNEAELLELDFKRRFKPPLASFNSSGFDDCIGQAAIAFKDDVLRELRSRCPKPGTWEKQNNESMIRLLERAQLPLTVGDDHEIEAYILPGSDAEAYLQPHVTLHGPIITEGQQPFQWDKNKGRPIEQLFERLCNLDRVVSVQDPSRKTSQSSCKQMTLAEVRGFMLDTSSETRGLNVLEMRNPIVHNTYPRFLSGNDCQLLDQIRDVVLDSATAQRIEATGNDWIKWKDDSIFTLLAQGGSQTLLHVDSGGKGTWLTVQEGLLGFGWLSRPTEQEIREWRLDPVSFCAGRLRYVVIGPGKTFYFRPGTIHFVFRLQGTPTLVFGGHVMRWSDILLWMDLLREQLEAPNSSNEDLSPEMTRTYVDAVEQLIDDRVERGWSDDITDEFNSRKKDLYDYLAESSYCGAGRSRRKH